LENQKFRKNYIVLKLGTVSTNTVDSTFYIVIKIPASGNCGFNVIDNDSIHPDVTCCLVSNYPEVSSFTIAHQSISHHCVYGKWQILHVRSLVMEYVREIATTPKVFAQLLALPYNPFNY
jgi:hypothetical protein